MAEAVENTGLESRNLLHTVVDDVVAAPDTAATATAVVLRMLELGRKGTHILEDFDRHHRSSLVVS